MKRAIVLALYLLPAFAAASENTARLATRETHDVREPSLSSGTAREGVRGAGTVRILLADAGTRSITIPAGDLLSALDNLTNQTKDIQLLYRRDQLQGIQTKGVNGNYTTQDAIRKLLEGTKLRLSTDAKGVMLIAPVGQAAAADNAAPRVDGTTLAQNLQRVEAPNSSSSPGAGEGRGEASQDRTSGQDEQSGSSKNRNSESQESSGTKGIPEILVKGKKSLNTDIERTEDDIQPYVVFDREQIERSQATGLEDFLKTRLPMNASRAVGAQTPGNVSGSMTYSQIDLRGLGTDETLILVDGRRMPSIALLSGQSAQPDIGGIPLSAIERIEVLPATAGGIYGGSATGGVVNIITRRDYSGMELNASYGNSFDSDVAVRRVDGSAGFSLEGGRTRVMLTGSRSDANDLLLGDRQYNQRGRQLLLENNPSSVLGSATPPLGATVNISSRSTNLVLKPQFGGRNLGSTIANLPLGYEGIASDNGAGIKAGTYNLDVPVGVGQLGLSKSLYSAPQLSSVTASVRRSFGESIQAFVDLSRLDRKDVYYSFSTVPNSVTNLPATAPNNPFMQDIRVRFPMPFLPNTKRFAGSETMRAIGGVIFELPRNWMATIEHGWSLSSRFPTQPSAGFYSDINAALASGLPTAAGRPALNVLQEGNSHPLDVSAYILPQLSQAIDKSFDSELKTVTLRFSGPVLKLPGGPLNLSGMLEQRKAEVLSTINGYLNPATGSEIYLYNPSQVEKAKSYYLELRAPIISASTSVKVARELEMHVSVRGDRYRNKGTVVAQYPLTSPDSPLPDIAYTTSGVESNSRTVGLRFVPVDSLALRASYSVGFLPPKADQISPSPFLYVEGVNIWPDPKRGDLYIGDEGDYNVISQGNPRLAPERSKSWSAGVIVTPAWAKNLRLSLDYTKISKTDEISSVDPGYIMEHEDLFPGRVVRLPLTAEDTAANYSGGRVTEIDASYVNFAKTNLEAYDVQADQLWDAGAFGTFHALAIVTYQPSYFVQILRTVPGVDFAGFRDGPLKWRGNLGLTWGRGPLTLGWSAQYYDSHRVYSADLSDREAEILNQGGEQYPSQTYHDLFVKYRLDAFAGKLSALSHTEISLGLQNVFDREPTIIATAANRAYDTLGDPRQRRYTLGVSKSFGGR